MYPQKRRWPCSVLDCMLRYCHPPHTSPSLSQQPFHVQSQTCTIPSTCCSGACCMKATLCGHRARGHGNGESSAPQASTIFAQVKQAMAAKWHSTAARAQQLPGLQALGMQAQPADMLHVSLHQQPPLIYALRSALFILHVMSSMLRVLCHAFVCLLMHCCRQGAVSTLSFPRKLFSYWSIKYMMNVPHTSGFILAEVCV